MAANRYTQPAVGTYVNDVLPIPFAQLYQIGTALGNEAKLAESRVNDFLEKNAQFQSPSMIDTENHYNMTIEHFRPIAEQMMSNPDFIKTPEGRAAINNTIRTVDYAGLSNLRQSRDNMLHDLELRQKMQAAGLWNKNWHDLDYSQYDTLNSKSGFMKLDPNTGEMVPVGFDHTGYGMKGIFNRSVVPYRDLASVSLPFFDNLKPSFDPQMSQASGGVWDYYRISPNDLQRSAEMNALPLIENDQTGANHFRDVFRQVASEVRKVNPYATDDEIREIALPEFKRRMIQTAEDRIITTRNLNDEYKLQLQESLRATPRRRASGSGSETKEKPVLGVWQAIQNNVSTVAKKGMSDFIEKLSIDDPAVQSAMMQMDSNRVNTYGEISNFNDWATNVTNEARRLSESGDIEGANRVLNDFAELNSRVLINAAYAENLKNSISGNRNSSSLINSLKSTVTYQSAKTYLDMYNNTANPHGEEALTKIEKDPVIYTNLYNNAGVDFDFVNDGGAIVSDYEPEMLFSSKVDPKSMSFLQTVDVNKLKDFQGNVDAEGNVTSKGQIGGLLDYFKQAIRNTGEIPVHTAGEVYPFKGKNDEFGKPYLSVDAFLTTDQVNDIIKQYKDDMKAAGTPVKLSNGSIRSILFDDLLEGGRSIGKKEGDYYKINTRMSYNPQAGHDVTRSLEREYQAGSSTGMRDAAYDYDWAQTQGQFALPYQLQQQQNEMRQSVIRELSVAGATQEEINDYLEQLGL